MRIWWQLLSPVLRTTALRKLLTSNTSLAIWARCAIHLEAQTLQVGKKPTRSIIHGSELHHVDAKPSCRTSNGPQQRHSHGDTSSKALPEASIQQAATHAGMSRLGATAANPNHPNFALLKSYHSSAVQQFVPGISKVRADCNLGAISVRDPDGANLDSAPPWPLRCPGPRVRSTHEVQDVTQAWSLSIAPKPGPSVELCKRQC
mmetsp:Transcript_44052/g.104882  ORF Transcript_44052/g.104882 Transcript_44052/m.104882 type:complete len:204 (-) Transcript_44052:789-1400(-)